MEYSFDMYKISMSHTSRTAKQVMLEVGLGWRVIPLNAKLFFYFINKKTMILEYTSDVLLI